jgi:hypothetical protein
MTAASIGAGRGAGYAQYLEGKTVAPERGDYYLTPDGELTEAPGRWLSDPETLARLEIDGSAPVDGPQFVALMEGRDPGTGRWLRPAGADGNRGGGIDVTFSAPKSVSVVWALGDPWQREQIEAAHARAVERSVGYLKERVPVVRRRYDGQVVEEHAKDVIATAYRHTTARGVSGAEAPDPQLHSHVVITGAVREQGYAIEQGTGKDGKYFEIAGVPRGLIEDFSGRHREVARAAERFRAKHGRAPERGELRDLALENRRAKELSTRGDLQRVWSQTGARHGFGADQAVHLVTFSAPSPREQPLEDRIEARLTEHTATFEAGLLRAVALEQSAGQLSPDEAVDAARGMIAERRVLALEGGQMTTLAIRAQEQAIERHAAMLGGDAGRDVGEQARSRASREVSECIAAPLSVEQEHALATLTGPERLAVLIGPAGTGKGVVIDAAARAEQIAGRDVLGVAVSGSTAERLGADSPALQGQTLTLDALVARANTGRLEIGAASTVFFDEAGMADHKRLEALTDLIARSGAKLVAVGDGKQLPSIGPGGMFDRLATQAPTAELADVHRTSDPDERRAWAALRAGEPERAMAHYQARGRLFFTDTRDQAGEAGVKRWAELTETHQFRDVALIADASNIEIDRLNARAQQLRAERGELGEREVALPHQHYGLHEGDLVTFTAQHRTPGEPRIENGARGEVTRVHEREGLTVKLDGSERVVSLAGEYLENLRLAYAQHVYRQQGATVERSVVVTGGWQTSKESSYVQASRAHQGTEFFLAREELGSEGLDAGRVERLSEKMRISRAQTPSLEQAELPDPDWGPGFARVIAPGRSLLRGITPERERNPDRDRAPGWTR